jgi:hypothetical protein
LPQAIFASGFAPGDFDPDTGLSIVRENNAHSWVEVYFPGFAWITFEPSSIRAIPPRIDDASAVAAPPPPSTDVGASSNDLTNQELDELLSIAGDQATVTPPTPFWLTLPGLALIAFGIVLGLAAVGSAVLAIAWRYDLGRLTNYQRPYAELVKLGRWSGAVHPRVSDTPLEVADRMRRQVPRAHAAIEQVTDAYVEATYAGRPPQGDPRPTWLAARRDVIRGLFSRRLGGWFGEDTSVAPPPRSRPDLLRTWGARRRQD